MCINLASGRECCGFLYAKHDIWVGHGTLLRVVDYPCSTDYIGVSVGKQTGTWIELDPEMGQPYLLLMNEAQTFWTIFDTLVEELLFKGSFYK